MHVIGMTKTGTRENGGEEARGASMRRMWPVGTGPEARPLALWREHKRKKGGNNEKKRGKKVHVNRARDAERLDWSTQFTENKCDKWGDEGGGRGDGVIPYKIIN